MDRTLLQRQIATHFELVDKVAYEKATSKEVELSDQAMETELPLYLKEEYAKKHKKEHANILKEDIDPDSNIPLGFYIEDAYTFCVLFPEYIEIYLNDEMDVLFQKWIVDELIEDMKMHGATLRENLKGFLKGYSEIRLQDYSLKVEEEYMDEADMVLHFYEELVGCGFALRYVPWVTASPGYYKRSRVDYHNNRNLQKIN